MLIRHRIYISLLLLSLLPLALISVLTYQVAENALNQVIVRDFQGLAREKADAIGRLFDERINEVRLLAMHPSIIAAVQRSNSQYQGRNEEEVMAEIHRLDKAWITSKGATEKAERVAGNELSSLLKNIQNRRPSVYGEMFVTDNRGATVAMTRILSDYYQADEYWWQTGNTYVESGAFLDDRGYDESVGAIVIGIVVPVLHDGEVIGVFKINFRVKAILDIVSGEGLEPGYLLLLVRSDGSVISGSDEGHPERLGASELQTINVGVKGVWKPEVHGGEKLAAYYPMKHTFSTRHTKDAIIGVAGETTVIKNWYVIYEVAHEVAFASLQELRKTAIVLGVGALALAILLGSLLSRAIFLPLSVLKSGTEAIGGGNLAYHIPLKKKDEFGALAHAFNSMSNKLQETLASRDELNQEIAERKTAEKQLEQTRTFLQDVINSMPSVLVAVDTEGRVNQWSKEAARMIGLDSSEILGQKLEDVLPLSHDLMHRVQAALQENVPGKLLRQECEFAGKQYFMDITVYPLTGKQQTGTVIRLDDVTERVRIESMMTQTEKMSSIGGLAAGMSHELNNPLGGILQSLQNIRRRFSPEIPRNREVAQRLELDLEKVRQYMEERQIEHFMENMEEAGGRAADVVGNLVKFIRQPEAGSVAEDIAELINRTLELAALDYDMKKKYGFRELEIVRDYDSELMSVPCVASEIQQVLLNGLQNAAQAISKQEGRTEPGRIIVRTRKRGNTAHIEVEDNGPGMDEETRRRVFEPFFTTRDPGEGTGLGLSVSYFIVHDQHKGRMSMESTPGKGAKLIVELPLEGESL